MSTRPDNSEIVTHKGGGITYSGRDAVHLFRAMTLRGNIKLFVKTKMIPTRGVTGPVMLRIATEITKKPYKRGQYAQAVADLDVWIETMKAALPITHE